MKNKTEDIETLRKQRETLEKELERESSIVSEKIKLEQLKKQLQELHPSKAKKFLEVTKIIAKDLAVMMKENKARQKKKLGKLV